MTTYKAEIGPLMAAREYVGVDTNVFGSNRAYPIDYGSGKLCVRLPRKGLMAFLGMTVNLVEERYPTASLSRKRATLEAYETITQLAYAGMERSR